MFLAYDETLSELLTRCRVNGKRRIADCFALGVRFTCEDVSNYFLA